MNPRAKRGEDLTILYLKNHHFNIINRNVYWCKHEIDIIAEKNQQIYLIEVKQVTNIYHLKVSQQQRQAYNTFICKYYPNQYIITYISIVHGSSVTLVPMEL